MSYTLTADELQRVVSSIEMPDGSQRAFYDWRCDAQAAIASLLIIPGLGEHGGRYVASAEEFSNQGFDTFAIDLVGHGLSPGKRGCIASYEGLLDEIEAALKVVSERNPDLPIVLWGHSMGGNLVINYLLRKAHLPTCAIASAPMLRATNPPSKAFEWFARRLAFLWPDFYITTPGDYRDCTRDPEQLEQMKSDKLFHKRVSLLLGMHLIDSGAWAIENASALQTKLLVLHGDLDAITSPVASKEFAASCSEHCDFRMLPNRLHDVHRDLDGEKVRRLMVDWLVTQFEQPASA